MYGIHTDATWRCLMVKLHFICTAEHVLEKLYCLLLACRQGFNKPGYNRAGYDK
jgi:hypothetical protein